MAAAGLTRVIVTLGYGADAIAAHLAGRDWPVEVLTVMTDFHKPNGVSALAARALVGPEGAVMAMCDHLVLPRHYRRLARAGAGEGLRLGIDRRLGHPWVDPLDVTCVATRGDRIVAIGKELERTTATTPACSRWGRRSSMRSPARQPVADRGRAHPCRAGPGAGGRLQRSRLAGRR